MAGDIPGVGIIMMVHDGSTKGMVAVEISELTEFQGATA